MRLAMASFDYDGVGFIWQAKLRGPNSRLTVATFKGTLILLLLALRDRVLVHGVFLE
jgi:hypothetical protein